MLRLGSITGALALVIGLGALARPTMAAPFAAQLLVPNSTIVSFSPDGRWLLASSPLPHSAGDAGSLRALPDAADRADPKLCVYAFPRLSVRACTQPGVLADSRLTQFPGGVAWSADGNTVLFSEGSSAFLVDGDIWRMDTTTGQLTDLTDDQFAGRIEPGGYDTVTVDLDTQPVMLSDGLSVAFVRLVMSKDHPRAEIDRLEMQTGATSTIATMPSDHYYVLVGNLVRAALNDQLWFTTTGADMNLVGLWTVEPAGGNLRQITAAVTDRKAEMVLLSAAPNSSQALVLLPRMLNRFEMPYYALVDLTTGATTPVQPAQGAGQIVAYIPLFDGDGHVIIIQNGAAGDDGARTAALLRRDLTTGDETRLADGLPPLMLFPGNPSDPGARFLSADLIAYPTTSDEIQAPWTVVSLSGVNPLPATPTATGFAPGMTVVTSAPTALRSTPSPDAPIAASLEAGAELIVIDAPVTVDGVIWLPVRDPVTGALGYVQASAVAPAEPTANTSVRGG